MKTVRSGHYSTTIKIGYNNNIIVDVVKIVATFSPIDRYISPEIRDPNKGPKIRNSINI